MFCRALWLISALFLFMVVGPVAVSLGTINKTDSADIYLIIDFNADAAAAPGIKRAGALEIGPERARFARMVFAPQFAKERLMAMGYIMLPAGAIAAICGRDIADPTSITRNS